MADPWHPEPVTKAENYHTQAEKAGEAVGVSSSYPGGAGSTLPTADVAFQRDSGPRVDKDLARGVCTECRGVLHHGYCNKCNIDYRQGTITIGDTNTGCGGGAAGDYDMGSGFSGSPLPLGKGGRGNKETPVPFSKQDLFNLHDEICRDAKAIMLLKNQDYANGDTFGNLRMASAIGIDPVLGILLRCMDKLARVRSFVESGSLVVKDESVRDSLVDIVNYAILAAGMIQERQLKGLLNVGTQPKA